MLRERIDRAKNKPRPDWSSKKTTIRQHRPSWRHRVDVPWWGKLLIVLAVIGAVVVFLLFWHNRELSGRLLESEVNHAENMAEISRLMALSDQLQENLDNAPTAEEVESLNAQNDSLNREIAAQNDVIVGWAGRVEELEAVTARQQQLIETQQEMFRTQALRALSFQTAETARLAALPGQIVDNLQANPPDYESGYAIAIYQETVEEAFGQHFFGWLDELKSVVVRGSARFEANGSFSAQPAGDIIEVRIPLPTMVSHGLHDFTYESFDYDPGILARIDNQDINGLMVWVEHDYLIPKACADIAAFVRVVATAETQVKSVAGSVPVEIIWFDQAGEEFSAGQLKSSRLLEAGC